MSTSKHEVWSESGTNDEHGYDLLLLTWIRPNFENMFLKKQFITVYVTFDMQTFLPSWLTLTYKQNFEQSSSKVWNNLGLVTTVNFTYKDIQWGILILFDLGPIARRQTDTENLVKYGYLRNRIYIITVPE